MEKRLLLSLALALLVLWGFNRFLVPPVPVEVSPSEAPVEEEVVAEAEFSEAAAAAEVPVREESSQEIALEQDVQAERVEDIMLETDVYVARLSNEGARLESLRLLRYRDTDGEPLELIRQDTGAKLGWPLSIMTGGEATDETIAGGRFVVQRDGNRLRFELGVDGLYVSKEFRFDPVRYAFELETTVLRDGEPVPFALTWAGIFGDQSVEYAPNLLSVVRWQDGNFISFATARIGQLGWFDRLRGSGQPPEAGLLPTTRVGVEDQYFLAMFLLGGPELPMVVADSWIPVDAATGEAPLPTPRLSVPNTGGPVTLYVGPKQPDALAATDPELASVIDYGFFGFFSAYFQQGLTWIHDNVVENYGWSIIIFTVLINLVFFPLRIKQQMSMLKMQKLGPQMRSLQDKMKKLRGNDPRKQELQMEMMGLYKKHGVNPLGGCLPLLLQMPFLFAMFSVLRTSIELRQAPWALWIQDLSRPDPLVVVLPGLMGLSMFAMQRMTPTTVDPAQARMMLIMPVVLPLMLLRMQSGLMLYWLTSNLVGIGQQYFIKKFWAPDIHPAKKSAAVADTVGEDDRARSPEPGSGTEGGASQGSDGSVETDGSQEPKKKKRRRKK